MDDLMPPPTRRELVVTLGLMAALLVGVHFALPVLM
ncbi:MAG: hypothetical protein QOD77_395 [Thermoplasmata archaeon]|jgi:hypothetical protein|nr:hypothetical protein [Thermoplasmata archaeon]